MGGNYTNFTAAPTLPAMRKKFEHAPPRCYELPEGDSKANPGRRYRRKLVVPTPMLVRW